MPSIRPLPGACGRSSATVWMWSPPADRRLMPTVAWEDSGRTATPMQRCSWIARCPSWMGMRRPPRSSQSPFWGVYAQTAENSITQIQVQQARTGNPLGAGFRMVAKAAGFSVQILARCAGRRAVCPSPVAKQVFSDTDRSAMNRTTASLLEDSRRSVSVTEFSAVWAYTPSLQCVSKRPAPYLLLILRRPAILRPSSRVPSIHRAVHCGRGTPCEMLDWASRQRTISAPP